MLNSRRYPSKIILFGEYTVLLGAAALAMPLPAFGGVWQQNITKKKDALATDLDNFMQFLIHNNELFLMDTAAIEKQMSVGLHFDSDIPLGYGLGSSGALSAAAYDIFCTEKTENVTVLKNIFSQMESHFHGASSGIDPLVSYLQQPIMLQNNRAQSVPVAFDFLAANTGFFLINTNKRRYSEPLVKWFKAQCEDSYFIEKCRAELCHFNEAAIAALLEKNAPDLWKQMTQISSFQYENLKPLIPADFLDSWKQGLESDYFKIKICGAGGGGFLLGYTRNYDQLPFSLTEHLIKVNFDLS